MFLGFALLFILQNCASDDVEKSFDPIHTLEPSVASYS